MSSVICFNLVQSKILSSENGLSVRIHRYRTDPTKYQSNENPLQQVYVKRKPNILGSKKKKCALCFRRFSIAHYA